MSNFFDETMQGLLEAAEIAKGNITLTEYPADRSGQQRNAAHRQEHGGSRQQRSPASVKQDTQKRKSCKFCSFFVCRLGIYPYICTSNRSNPGTIPTTLSRGGESFKRLLRITPFSAMFFYARPAKRHADLRPPIRRSSASQPARRSAGRQVGRSAHSRNSRGRESPLPYIQKRFHVLPFIAIFAVGFS